MVKDTEHVWIWRRSLDRSSAHCLKDALLLARAVDSVSRRAGWQDASVDV